jgi:thiosulfate dehydrogenase [quinone] large subunit
LRDFLLNVAVPHATLFGGMVAYGELAIGLGVLLGLLLRPAAVFGLLINLVFFLSADWRIFPYFYGSDIVFIFCWLTLLIAGPANQVLPALDTWLVRRLVERATAQNQPRLVTFCEVFFGVKVGSGEPSELQTQQSGQLGAARQAQSGRQQAGKGSQKSGSMYRAWQLEQAQQQARRNFIWGTLTGGGVMLALAWVVQALHLLPGSDSTSQAAQDGSSALATPTSGDVAPTNSPTPSSPGPGGTIAKISDVPTNSSFSFTLPSSNDPGVLVHLNNGQFVAYDAVCTHAGCTVDYDPSSQQLICPCHGAAFDPSKSAEVINGPAQFPLATVKIAVDQNAGTVSLGQ